MSDSFPGPEVLPSSAIDPTKPSIARSYDYAIGGKHNYEPDRELLRKLNEAVPEVNIIARTNRNFLIRAVRFLALHAGLDQFLDCGSGLPTAENTHQIAQRVTPEARVVYVDNDPVVLAHGRALLEENENTLFLDADIFTPSIVLNSEVVRNNLDFSRPVALLQVGTLCHHSAELGIPPVEVMREYIDALPRGSYVAFSHFLDPEDEHTALAHQVQEILNDSMPDGGFFRTRAEILEMLDGLELVDPGLVINDNWWPDGPRITSLPAAGNCIAAAIGRKP